MKQINIKFKETIPVDMKVYRRIKFAAEGITEYIRQLVLRDIAEEELLLKYKEELLKADGEKD